MPEALAAVLPDHRRADTALTTDPRVSTFMAALQAFEQSSDPAALTKLFAPGAVLTRLGDHNREQRDVTAFWQEYRATFHDVATTFTHVIGAADEYALEWATAASLTNQHPISCRGVTALGFHGAKISSLRTYYDTAAFAHISASPHMP